MTNVRLLIYNNNFRVLSAKVLISFSRSNKYLANESYLTQPCCLFFLPFPIQMVDLFSDFEGELILTSHMSQATKSVKILQQALGGLLISPFPLSTFLKETD